MSLIRTGLLLAAVVMLLPMEERKQAELASTASRAAAQTATFCDRNPSTCATGRDMWALLLAKAEYGMELGARLLREQLLRSSAPEAPPASPPQQAGPSRAARGQIAHVEPHPALAPRSEAPAMRRNSNAMDHAPRWR